MSRACRPEGGTLILLCGIAEGVYLSEDIFRQLHSEERQPGFAESLLLEVGSNPFALPPVLGFPSTILPLLVISLLHGISQVNSNEGL